MVKNKQAEPTLEFILPRGSVFSLLPKAVSPYVEITRMHIPPINTTCFYPFAVGLAYSADKLCVPWSVLLQKALGTYILSFLAGCAGHTWDDALDYDIDVRYERCKNRPIVRGSLSRRAAFIYATVLSALFHLAIWVIHGPRFLMYGVACQVFFCLYPVSKRVTNYPQIVLGILHAIPVLWLPDVFGIDLTLPPVNGNLYIGSSKQASSIGALYAAFGINTMLFDIGYGLLDVEDDVRNSIGSMSVRFGGHIKLLLYALAIAHVALLICSGQLSGFGWVFFVGAAIAAVELAYLIGRLEPARSESVVGFFMSVSFFVGGQMILSLFGDYVSRCLL